MNSRLVKSLAILIVSASSMLSAARDAAATPISVTGWFTDYTGGVTCAGIGADNIFNGVDASVLNCNPGEITVNETIALAGAPSAVDFYVPGQTPNSLEFTPAPQQEINQLGDEILLGTFTITNGIWTATNGSFGFRVVTQSSGAFDQQVLQDTIVWAITANTHADPAQNADFVYFLGFSSLGSIRVYEKADSPTGSNIGSADVYARIDSVIPSRFANPRGAAFLNPDITSEPTPVPEPGTMLLLGSGLVAMMRHRSRGGQKG